MTPLQDTAGSALLTLDDWARLYDTPQRAKQWKKGRSAWSVAEFVLERNGLDHIARRASQVLESSLVVQKAIPEYEVRFDAFGRGRVHDLGVSAMTSDGDSVFVGVEAKVDESFGATVLDSYLDAKAKEICGIATNAPRRIEALLGKHFREPSRKMFDVRYQLLYATVGTIAAQAARSLFYVLVFRTDQYNERKGAENLRDYLEFMEQVGARPVRVEGAPVYCHELELEGSSLRCVYEFVDL